MAFLPLHKIRITNALFILYLFTLNITWFTEYYSRFGILNVQIENVNFQLILNHLSSPSFVIYFVLKDKSDPFKGLCPKLLCKVYLDIIYYQYD